MHATVYTVKQAEPHLLLNAHEGPALDARAVVVHPEWKVGSEA